MTSISRKLLGPSGGWGHARWPADPQPPPQCKAWEGRPWGDDQQLGRGTSALVLPQQGTGTLKREPSPACRAAQLAPCPSPKEQEAEPSIPHPAAGGLVSSDCHPGVLRASSREQHPLLPQEVPTGVCPGAGAEQLLSRMKWLRPVGVGCQQPRGGSWDWDCERGHGSTIAPLMCGSCPGLLHTPGTRTSQCLRDVPGQQARPPPRPVTA